ncbi:MAG: competence/damage-inducible protein A [Verrucomicrobia bacterium]|nr:competence/damage-inducible protein A [Verrucomicrobiota bacterium]
MNIELINTGTELLLGRVLNTHQQWLGAELANLGFPVTRQVTIPDSGPAMETALRDALGRADLVITTGGLGPTSDDITRELIAQLLGIQLKLDRDILAQIEKFFAIRNRAVPSNAFKQAMIPEGAIVLLNTNGTAPGLALSIPGSALTVKKWLIMLPGPPRELQPMFTEQVIPILRREFGTPTFVCRTFKTTGLGEAFIEQRIAPHLERLVNAGIELGYCAKVGQVEVRLSARNADTARFMSEAEAIVHQQLGTYIFASNEVSLEEVVVSRLAGKHQTLALAESCTGGLISNRITNVPGASAIFIAGLITYSNEAKQMLLGVRTETLERHGAVSEQTAREMAEGARTRHKTDYAIAVTGIAGPTGGTTDKPVGTVFIGLAMPGNTIIEKNFNPYDRETFKYLTSQQALDLLRKNLGS